MRIQSIARRTPVLDVSDLAGRPLVLKCEPQQPAGAFKIRGATNMLMRLEPGALRRGVITYSSGNHGQAVALAALEARRAGRHRHADDGAGDQGRRSQAVGRRGDSGRHDVHRAPEARGGRGRARADSRWCRPSITSGSSKGRGPAGSRSSSRCLTSTIVVVPVGGGGLVSGVSAAVSHLRPDVQRDRRRAGGRGEDDRVASGRAPGHARPDRVDRRWSDARAARRPDVRARRGVRRSRS